MVVLLDRLVRCLRAGAGGAELAPAEEEEQGGQQHQDDRQENAHHHNLVKRNVMGKTNDLNRLPRLGRLLEAQGEY